MIKKEKETTLYLGCPQFWEGVENNAEDDVEPDGGDDDEEEDVIDGDQPEGSEVQGQRVGLHELNEKHRLVYLSLNMSWKVMIDCIFPEEK